MLKVHASCSKNKNDRLLLPNYFLSQAPKEFDSFQNFIKRFQNLLIKITVGDALRRNRISDTYTVMFDHWICKVGSLYYQKIIIFF